MRDLLFMECDSCRSKQGFPILCDSCLHNRTVISKLTPVTPSERLRRIAFDLSEIAMNCPRELNRSELTKMAARMLASSAHVELGERASQPPAVPVAWQRVVDSSYEPGPRMQFCDSKNRPMGDGWEPLYTQPAQSPTPEPKLISTVEMLREVEEVLIDLGWHKDRGVLKRVTDCLDDVGRSLPTKEEATEQEP